MRRSGNVMQAGVIKNGYSYEHQCWIKDFVIQDCAHPATQDCGCFGRMYAGKQARFSE
jgi:hypothetical protein